MNTIIWRPEAAGHYCRSPYNGTNTVCTDNTSKSDQMFFIKYVTSIEGSCYHLPRVHCASINMHLLVYIHRPHRSTTASAEMTNEPKITSTSASTTPTIVWDRARSHPLVHFQLAVSIAFCFPYFIAHRWVEQERNNNRRHSNNRYCLLRVRRVFTPALIVPQAPHRLLLLQVPTCRAM